jgi:hypothetical protein
MNWVEGTHLIELYGMHKGETSRKVLIFAAFCAKH